MKNLILLSILLLPIYTTAQGEIKGKLLRIHFAEQEINVNDTVSSWSYVTGAGGAWESWGEYSFFEGRVIFNENELFLKQRYSYARAQWLPYSDYYFSIFNPTSKQEREFAIASMQGWDIIQPFMRFGTKTVLTDSGLFLINSVFGNGYITKENNFYESIYPDKDEFLKTIMDVFHIHSDTLIAITDDPKEYLQFGVYLFNLSDYPKVDTLTKLLEVDGFGKSLFSGRDLESFQQIGNSREFALVSNNRFYFSELVGDSLIWTDSTDFDFYLHSDLFNGKNWYLTKENLFVQDDSRILQYDFDIETKEFSNEQSLIDSLGTKNFNFDREYKHFTIIEDDSLKLFGLPNFVPINSWSLASIKYPEKVFVDSPYVFIHYEETRTDVEKNQEIPINIKLEIYPNPFNSKTNIVYQLPAENRVQISLFNALGEKLIEIDEGLKPVGSHKSLLEMNQYSSGIYFVIIESNTQILTRKIILLK